MKAFSLFTLPSTQNKFVDVVQLIDTATITARLFPAVLYLVRRDCIQPTGSRNEKEPLPPIRLELIMLCIYP